MFLKGVEIVSSAVEERVRSCWSETTLKRLGHGSRRGTPYVTSRLVIVDYKLRSVGEVVELEERLPHSK